MFGLLRVAAGINILALVGVCVFLLWNGSPAISWEFLTEPPRRMMTAGGVWPCIVGTFLLAFGAMLIAFPLGVASAVYLHEYGGKGRYTRYLRLGISNLAGVPSVVFGLFGLAFFVTFLGMGVSLLAGVLTLGAATTGVLAKLFSEAVEAIEPSPVEGVRSTGASFLEEVVYGVIPQVFPLWISYSLYRFESNVRSATVVGMVGAGGIGMVLWELIRSFAFEQTCAVMALIVLVVVVFDMLSQQLRKRVL